MNHVVDDPELSVLQAHPQAAFPREAWQSTRPAARWIRLKDRILADAREIDTERARYATDSYRLSEGEPTPVRRAKMLLHLVRTLSIAVDPDELIVGNRSLKPRMGVIAPEGAVNWIDRELDVLPTRAQDRFNILPEQIGELRSEIFPYWQGKTLEDRIAGCIPENVACAVRGKVFSLNQCDHAQGHILPNVVAWLHLGINGLRERVEALQQQPDSQSPDQQIHFSAALLALQAAREFMQRYAVLAGEQARRSESPERRQELARIAANCDWLSDQAPRDFWEALQAVWFLFVLLQIESNASSFSPGRFDQYMLAFLEADLACGQLSLPEAQNLLEGLWLKFNEIVLLRSSASARYFAGFPIGFNLILGGQKPGGGDATNILSYMCLRAQADLGLTQPNLSVRIHRQSPQEFLLAAASVIRKGSGMPQIFNDEVIIPGQMSRGIMAGDALNYAVVGCVELSIPGKALGWSDASMFNLTRVLELALFGGKDPHSAQQIGPVTPALDQMSTIEELEAAYDLQLTHFVDLMVKGCNVVERIHAEMLPSPFLSLVVDNCLARGMDVTAGGAMYNFSGVQGVQIANVADSLAAVKQAVFDQRWLSAGQLLDTLRSNFKDQEVLRQRLINRVPKYGNDEDLVDRFAQMWAERFCALVGGYQNTRGGTYQPGFYTVSSHIPMGANVGATPDGRRSGEPLADGGLSAMTGRDSKGPTALLRSVDKLNLSLASNGTLLNMKFSPMFFDGEQALEKFVTLLRGFCRLRIPHVQFNVVSAAMLREAQANPTSYRSLVVRVAGYSAYFTELDKDLQDEIIRRTEFGQD